LRGPGTIERKHFCTRESATGLQHLVCGQLFNKLFALFNAILARLLKPHGTAANLQVRRYQEPIDIQCGRARTP
jgi:hypothetical protein